MVVVVLLSRLCVRMKLCLAHNKRGVMSYVYDSLLCVMGDVDDVRSPPPLLLSLLLSLLLCCCCAAAVVVLMVVVVLLSRLCVRTKLSLAHNKRGVLSYVCL